MDLYVERQAIEQMRAGDASKFMLLFDENFTPLYRYVMRRVFDSAEAERVVRMTFLDALGQMHNTPLDTSYTVWLYSLAKPRVWDYLARNNEAAKAGRVYDRDAAGTTEENLDLLTKADNVFGKLLLEEKEILRLKFFEEVADGDVMTVLGIQDGTIGSKIYRVLKRAHFLLFGESDDRQGVYFGELSGFLARMRDLEKVEIPEVLKLNLKADFSARIDRKDFAIEVEPEEESNIYPDAPFKTVDPADMPKGSNDPAKVFVEAVREMREEEEQERLREQLKAERREAAFDALDRWKHVLVIVPVVLFVGLIGFLAYKFLFDGKISRGYVTTCEVDVNFDGDFNDTQKRSLNKQVSDALCDNFEVRGLNITAGEDGRVIVSVDVPGWMLEYNFAKKNTYWRIKKYERTFSSNEESGKIRRDSGSA